MNSPPVSKVARSLMTQSGLSPRPSSLLPNKRDHPRSRVLRRVTLPLPLRRECEPSFRFNPVAKFPVEIGIQERAERILEAEIFVVTILGSRFGKVPKGNRVGEQIWIFAVCHAQHVEIALRRRFVDVGELR